MQHQSNSSGTEMKILLCLDPLGRRRTSPRSGTAAIAIAVIAVIEAGRLNSSGKVRAKLLRTPRFEVGNVEEDLRLLRLGVESNFEVDVCWRDGALLLCEDRMGYPW